MTVQPLFLNIPHVSSNSSASALELGVTSPHCWRAELNHHSLQRQVTFTPSLPFAPYLQAGAIFGVLLLPRWLWHSADSHMTPFIPGYRPPSPSNTDGMGQPESTGCANTNLLFWHFSQVADPVFFPVFYPGDVLHSVFNMSSAKLIP